MYIQACSVLVEYIFALLKQLWNGTSKEMSTAAITLLFLWINYVPKHYWCHSSLLLSTERYTKWLWSSSVFCLFYLLCLHLDPETLALGWIEIGKNIYCRNGGETLRPFWKPSYPKEQCFFFATGTCPSRQSLSFLNKWLVDKRGCTEVYIKICLIM